MNNNTCYDECVNTETYSSGKSSGLVIVIILYILLAIILGSFRAC